MIKNFVKIVELLGDRLEVCVSVFISLVWCRVGKAGQGNTGQVIARPW